MLGQVELNHKITAISAARTATASCLAASGRLTRGCGSNIRVFRSLCCFGYLIAISCHRSSRNCGPCREKIAKFGQGRVRKAWTVAQAPLRCFRRGYPPRKVIPPPIRIGDHYDRFRAMRSVFERLCPGFSERIKTVVDCNRLVPTAGFVCGSTRPRGMRISHAIPSRFRQQNLSPRVHEDVPDGILFESDEPKDKANRYPEERNRYEPGRAVVESRRWGRPLVRRSPRRGEEPRLRPKCCVTCAAAAM